MSSLAPIDNILPETTPAAPAIRRSTRGANKGEGYWGTGHQSISNTAMQVLNQGDQVSTSQTVKKGRTGGKNPKQEKSDSSSRAAKSAFQESSTLEASENVESLETGDAIDVSEKKKKMKSTVYTTGTEKRSWLKRRLAQEKAKQSASYQLPSTTTASSFYIPSQSIGPSGKYSKPVSLPRHGPNFRDLTSLLRLHALDWTLVDHAQGE
ncbi:uncharacterized protein JCM6883_002338 [Sporobolomyces salmoneus]|uniref:uncharacterized protein n=1 Tax=Sporobolomyces salmoneus TaxID=183962 RepID=UPI003181C27B